MSNPMDRPLRLAVIGGGPGSFIGGTHRAAARLDGRFEIVAGVVSSDPERSRAAAPWLGIEQDRAYPNVATMLESEVARMDGVEAVAIMTPNDSHRDFAIASVERGLDVICDKPMTNTLAEAKEVVRAVESAGVVFALTHNYTGYPMVRQARALVRQGALGAIRLVQVEYVQGGKASEDDPDPSGVLPWRYDPVLGGPSLVMGDIGTHAHNLLRFVTGLEVAEISADVGHVVPGRLVDDYAGALLRLEHGAKGVMWVTQAAAGMENALAIRVSGTAGSIEWRQERPTRLIYRPLSEPPVVFTPNGSGLAPGARRASRIVAGHPEGFLEAFANVYSDAAEAIAARRSGMVPDPLATEFPDHRDGAIGVAFVEAAIESSRNGGTWTEPATLD